MKPTPEMIAAGRRWAKEYFGNHVSAPDSFWDQFVAAIYEAMRSLEPKTTQAEEAMKESADG